MDGSGVLSSGGIAVLRQLFLQGPTWDGNIIGKQSRDELVTAGYAFHVEGYASLTKEGVELAVGSGIDREKERTS